MSAITETKGASSRLEVVRKLLAKAEGLMKLGDADSVREAEACNERAADLIAKYGIDSAMLVAHGTEQDEVQDRMIVVSKPFAKEFTDLLWYISRTMGAKTRLVKQFNPDLHGGRKKGGYEYGLRVFAFGADLMRIELVYASLRNQAMAGMSRIVDTSSQFGQTQKADRQSYLEGFASAVYWRLERAERVAKDAAKAEQEERNLQALAASGGQETGVELVLASRSLQVSRAMDLAYGITPDMRAKWAEQDRIANEKWEAGREERERQWAAEKAACPRCKGGRPCVAHGTARGRTRVYDRVGTRWHDGYDDGNRADLSGTQQGVGTGQKSLAK